LLSAATSSKGLGYKLQSFVQQFLHADPEWDSRAVVGQSQVDDGKLVGFGKAEDGSMEANEIAD
jgi:hypothetical protein